MPCWSVVVVVLSFATSGHLRGQTVRGLIPIECTCDGGIVFIVVALSFQKIMVIAMFLLYFEVILASGELRGNPRPSLELRAGALEAQRSIFIDFCIIRGTILT